jgi:hypothetical protein
LFNARNAQSTFGVEPDPNITTRGPTAPSRTSMRHLPPSLYSVRMQHAAFAASSAAAAFTASSAAAAFTACPSDGSAGGMETSTLEEAMAMPSMVRKYLDAVHDRGLSRCPHCSATLFIFF